MFTWHDVLGWLVSGLFQNFIWFLVGVVFVYFIWEGWRKWRFGGWVVILKQKGKVILRRQVSHIKAQESLDDASEKAVFLKGIVSPYARLNCDLIEVGPKLGLFLEDKKARQWVIDLDKNPPGGHGQVVE